MLVPLGLFLCALFYLTQINMGFKLYNMTMLEIKKLLLEAVRNDPNSADIKYVALFGSYVNGTPREDSDIDVLIEFYPQAVVGLFKFVDIQSNFSEALGKKVDLLTPQAISKYFRNKVLEEAEIVYEG